MSDNSLATLMGQVPSRCILLLEDLDAAFTRSVSRDEKSTGTPDEEKEKDSDSEKKKSSDGSTLSLSGLLNALDGVAAAEGRSVLITTFPVIIISHWLAGFSSPRRIISSVSTLH